MADIALTPEHEQEIATLRAIAVEVAQLDNPFWQAFAACVDVAVADLRMIYSHNDYTDEKAKRLGTDGHTYIMEHNATAAIVNAARLWSTRESG
jgi:ABC-type sugar transport system substrate-binding protein